jgi:hypothetical protein
LLIEALLKPCFGQRPFTATVVWSGVKARHLLPVSPGSSVISLFFMFYFL